jgi:hypothetical protein
MKSAVMFSMLLTAFHFGFDLIFFGEMSSSGSMFAVMKRGQGQPPVL